MTSSLSTYALVMTAPFALAWLGACALRIGPLRTRHNDSGWEDPDTRTAFDSARGRHARAQLAATITGRPAALRLRVLAGAGRAAAARCVGEHLVPLGQIVGSVDAGPRPFDRRFDPTDDRARARFSSVFAARLAGLSLPPVTLYRGSDGGYYVLDGHHRIAVARAFGDADVRAEVSTVEDG